ncbi:MAG: prolyl oligopeptidase family serine peptidase, partial [Actinomycetota bacterium]|nr:prolyl oligopeptidase family serine peptidase [Actinomycetota bacterium]
MPTIPYGSWPSPITAASLVERAVSLSDLRVDGDALYWIEARPSEAGRQVIVRWEPGSEPVDILPAPYSARTTVHEYGGAAFTVAGGEVYFSNFADQAVYRLGDPTPIAAGARYADFDVHGDRIVCVRERGDVNDIVELNSGDVVAAGHDFYAAPRFAPDGRLAWLAWDHPRMPWDGTLLEPGPVAGGPEESITQPRWSPAGQLHWISDRTGWWNIYRGGQPLQLMEAEFAEPDWVFGNSNYDFLPDGRVVAHWTGHLGVLGEPPLDLPFTSFDSVRVLDDDKVAAIAASPIHAPAVVVIDPVTAEVTVVRESRPTAVDRAYLSTPRTIDFPSTGGRTAHALFYPPANPACTGPAGELPPLVVTSHGGPTSQASTALNLRTQFWTSRGFAVVDVDYGGSSGYGRAYRRQLDGQWGVVDVDDCVAAAQYLAAAGQVDGRRMTIRGSSASGLTTLLALTRGTFAAGASLYGVADLAALATDTHKFEARYLDGLVGPWPEAADVYRERSPITHADKLKAPLIIFQGLEDKVVPPAQAEVLVDALGRAGVPFAYLTFEGEAHGFR